MRALVAGYGSIARRHVGNLRRICADRGEELVVDLVRTDPSGELPGGVRRAYGYGDDIPAGYDVLFVTNPTSAHHRTLCGLGRLAGSVFLEKPAFDRLDVDLGFLGKLGGPVYVACPLRYTAVLQWAKGNIDFARVVAARCISSSYLPDWRPGTDYRTVYSARKELGGGVSTDLIHEWDYIQFLMGFPREVKSIVAKRSPLEIDSDDVAVYIADWGDKVAELHLDYFGRSPMRALELFMDDDTVECDLLAGTVRFMKSGREVVLAEDRDSFQRRELEHFLDIAEGRAENDNDVLTAVRTLALTKGVLL